MNDSSGFRRVLKLLSMPLILLAAYLMLSAIWRLAGLPPDSELQGIVKGYFDQYGLWIVLIGALIEGFLLAGNYFPGGFVIFLGVITAGSAPRAAAVVAVVCLAFFISYTLNYWLGRYGWYLLLVKFGLKGSLDHTKRRMERQGLNAIIFSYWMPNLAAITATAAGILQVPLRKFLLFSAAGILIWNTFWGVLVFSLGDAALKLIGLKYVLIIFLAWTGILLLKHYLFDRRRGTANVP